jgi:thioredoxin 1
MRFVGMGLVPIMVLCVASTASASSAAGVPRRWSMPLVARTVPRGGGDTTATAESAAATQTTAAEEQRQDKELTLDEKVHAAMRKLGLTPPSDDAADADNCKDGVCEISQASAIASKTDEQVMPPPPPPTPPPPLEDAQTIADRISRTMKVDISMAWAALGATSTAGSGGDSGSSGRIYNEKAAREMIQLELEMIAQIPDDSTEVQQLVSEGYDNVFMVRRALAFAERNMEDARAILLADKMDEEDDAEREQQALLQQEQDQKQTEESFKTVNVPANFDPTKIDAAPPAAAAAATTKQPAPPKSANKMDVVFEATGANAYELIFESSVPVLLDVYADWCGPCKALTPILEDMAVKSGGAFRLVKVNSDNEKAIAGALQVTALPTVFGIRDGKILHMFQGMPKSEDMMKNFLMGLLVPGQVFNPPVSAAEKKSYDEISSKLIKVAGSAAFSFAARERLQDRIASRMDDLVKETGDVLQAEDSAKTVRSLLSNVIRDPFSAKFRSVNLTNKVIAAKIAKYPACVAVLTSIGFGEDGPETLTIGKGKKILNVASLSVARDSIDKWIDQTRYEVAKAARRRKDEQDRVQVQAELSAAAEAAAAAAVEEESDDEVDPNVCTLKLRVEGKKKMHEVSLQGSDPLRVVLDQIPGLSENEDVQILCIAKRLVVKATDSEAMSKTLQEHGLMPGAALVIKCAYSKAATPTSSSTLSERAAARKKKTGSHTMQSVGIYGKDDNAKGELVDGGGGTWYEQDVSDDEEPEKESIETKDVVEEDNVEITDDEQKESAKMSPAKSEDDL